MPSFPPEIIHQLYARYRFRNSFTFEKAGRTRYEMDPETGLLRASHSIVKLLPVGGFDGYLMGLPLDAEAPPRPQPKRTPAQAQLDVETMQDQELYDALFAHRR